MKHYYRFLSLNFLYKFTSIFFVLIGVFTPVLLGQNNALNINVQVLPPYSSDIHDYITSEEEVSRRFQEQVLINIKNNNPNRSYEVKLIPSVTGNNGVRARVNESFQPYRRIVIPAGEMKVISGRELARANQNLTKSDIIYEGFSKSQIRRTGKLPEGSYRVCVRAFDYETGQPLSAEAPLGCSPPIPISYPDPPVISYPFDGAKVMQTEPQALNITWAPTPDLPSQVRYKVRMVELTDVNANPYDLMEQTNIAYYEERGITKTNLFYDQTKPPLKTGNRYAIRIQAYDPKGQLQIKNDGWSEIHTFTYVEDMGDDETAAEKEFITLKPGYLRLVNLGDLEVTEQAGAKIYNGEADLQITTPSGNQQPPLVGVNVNNLSVSGGDTQNPVINQGSVEGVVNQQLPAALSDVSDLMAVNRIRWEANQGLKLFGRLFDSDGNPAFQARGDIQLTDLGVYGTITTTQTGGALFTMGEEPVRLAVNQLSAQLPKGTISANGNLRVFSENHLIESCRVNDINLTRDSLATSFGCQLNRKLSLVNNQNKATLEVKSIRGTLNPSWSNGSLDYDLEGVSEFNISSRGNNTCGINTMISLNSENGVDMEVQGEGCYATTRTLDMGMVNLLVEDISLEDIAYSSEEAGFDFALGLDAYLKFPVFDNWTSPRVEDISLTNNGITIPRQQWGGNALQDADSIGWGAHQLNLNALGTGEITYPWFGEIQGTGPWQVDFSGKLNPSGPGNFPACIRSANVNVSGSYDTNEGLSGTLSLGNMSCRYTFGAGYALAIHGIEGKLAGTYTGNSFDKSASLQVDADVKLGAPFACVNQNTAQVNNSNISFQNGFIKGNMQGFAPQCPLNIGPFKATITQSQINFSINDTTQSALLDARADLEVESGNTVSGTFVLDLMTGEFKEVDFQLNQPFTWDIPQQDPVLSFRINNASINENGLLIDGRQSLNLPQKTIDATFDNLLLDLNRRRIKSGSILFDESFALEAGLDTTDYSLDYQAVAPKNSLGYNPGLYFEMGARVTLDSIGLHAGDSANARLKFGNQNLTNNFNVDFTNNFAIGLFPFEVDSGRADFFFSGNRIAYIDDQGFNINPAQFVKKSLPAKIPLPTNNIAYLRVRKNGRLLVNINQQNDGTYALNSRPNQPLSLVMPLLDAQNPPTVTNVTINNVVLDPDLANPSIKSGSITATVPSNDPQFNLPSMDIPLALQEVSYGTNLNNTNTPSLYLKGNMHLFDRQVTQQGNFSLHVQSNGKIQGNFAMAVNNSVNLVQGSNRVTLDMDSISGFVDIPMAPRGPPNYRFNIDGALAVNASNNLAADADLGLKITPGDFTVTRFNSSVKANPPEMDLGYFGVKISEIPSLPKFKYSETGGFEFAAALNLDLTVDLAGNKSFSMPLKGVEITNKGLEIPKQDISGSSVPGLNIPALSIQGASIKPLALRTTATTVFNWYQGVNLQFSPAFDFAIRLPAFQGTNFNPPNGFTFNDVSFNQGILTGSMAPYNPMQNVNVPLSSNPQAPKLNISQIRGSLTRDTTNSGIQQGVGFQIDGSLQDLPKFTDVDTSVCTNPSFTLSIVEGEGFEGTINNFAPCGQMEMGPITLEARSSQLNFAYQNQQQSASMSGTVRLNLKDNPQPGGLADGQLGINLINGNLTSGYIQVNQAFSFAMPANSPDTLFNFTVNQARLDTTGFEFSGNGSLNAGNVSNSVSFNNLLLGLNNFEIKSGSANLGSSVALQLGFQPMNLKVVDTSTARPGGDHLRMEFGGDIMLNQYGLSYNASGTAAIRFSGNDYQVLRAEFLNNFAIDLRSLQVNRGRAEFFHDENGQASQPLAVWDANGFSIGGGVVAALPDTLGLPNKNVAYIVLKDQQGNPIPQVNQTQNNSWQLSNKNTQPLDIVFPGLASGGGNPPSAKVTMDIITDSNYNPQSGSITLNNNIDLEPQLNIPLLLNKVAINANSNTELVVGVGVDLPPTLTQDSVQGNLRVNSNGFVQGSLELGTFTQTYNASLQPQFTHDFSGNISGTNQQGGFTVNIMGVKAAFGANNTLGISGTIESDLLADDQGNQDPVFYTASYQNGQWNAGVDTNQAGKKKALGKIDIKPDPNNPVSVIISKKKFIVALNGTLSFKRLVGEKFDVHVDSLKVGTRLQPQTSLVFEMGSGSATLADQNISLFNGKASVLLRSPTVSINGKTIGVSGSGKLTLFNKDVSFSNMAIDNQNGFSVGNMQANNINLLDEYVKLSTIALSVQQNNTMALDATLDVKIPEPVEATSQASYTITRNSSGNVNVTMDGPQFDLNKKYSLGQSGGMASFKLTKIAVDLKQNLQNSGIYANGRVLINGRQRIRFGEDNNIKKQPGIAVSGQGTVDYNATGNASFTLDEGFFNITINANMAVSKGKSFEVVLGGKAGVNISGIGGQLDYDGFTITKNGVTDRGNLTGSGSLTLMGFAHLEVGQFIRKPKGNNSTAQVQVPKNGSSKPSDLKSDAGKSLATNPVTVTQYLQIGGQGRDAVDLTLGGKNPSGNSGGFKAEIQKVVFYEKPDNSKYLLIKQAYLEVGRTLELTADMEYETDGQGNFSLRAMATGSFYAGATSAKAALAGTFSNLNNNLKYGLFVGVQAQPGIPLFPGIIELTGVGGGYFYNPDQDDIKQITGKGGALASFGHKLVRRQIKPNAGPPPPAKSYEFAAMLYASVTILGSGSATTLDGSTFFKLTDQNVYFDARGTVLGLDGNGSAGLQMNGGTYFQARFDKFYIDGGFRLKMTVPVTMQADMIVKYFVGKDPQNQKVVWGIEGDLSAKIYQIIQPKGTIIACPNGVFISASIAANYLDFPVIKLKGKAKGSMWYADDPSFNMPFGAYLKLKAKFCVGFCVKPTGKAAFATKRGGGFELVAGLQGCQSTPFGQACVHAQASVEDGPDFSASAGTGKLDSDLFDKAENMKSRFQSMIQDIKDRINNMKNQMENLQPEVPETTIPDAIVKKAGVRFHSKPFLALYSGSIKSNLDAIPGSYGNSLDWVYDNIMINGASSSFPMERITQSASTNNVLQNAKSDMERAIETNTLFLEAALTRVNKAKTVAYDYKEQANQSFNNLISALERNPVRSVDSTINTDANGKVTSSASFDIDQSTAQAQRTSAENLSEDLTRMDQEFREAINATESNLDKLDSLLTEPLKNEDQDGGTTNTSGGGLLSSNDNNNNLQESFLQGSSQLDANARELIKNTVLESALPSLDDVSANLSDATEKIDAYYAQTASFYWEKRAWTKYAYNQLLNKKGQINNAIDGLWNNWSISTMRTAASMPNVSAHNTSVGQNIMSNSEERIDILYDIAEASSSEKQNAKSEHRNRMKKSISNMEARFKESAQRLWYDMHEEGLRELTDSLAKGNIDGIKQEHYGTRNIIENNYEDLTRDLNEAYSLKSEISSLLYNLYEKYGAWRENVLGETSGDSAQVAIKQEKNQLYNKLKAPQVSGVNVTTNRTNYYNHTNVSWSIQGNVGEVSYQISELSTTENIAGEERSSSPYLTAGNKSEINIYPYRKYYQRSPSANTGSSYHTIPYSIGLRLRSEGGSPILRRAQFDVNVGPNGSAPVANNKQVLDQDNTAPKIKYVQIPDATEEEKGANKIWTGNNQEINVYVGGRDDETDIAAFEYAIGSSEGATDIVDWSPLLGERKKKRYDPYNQEAYIVTRMIGSITSVIMEPGKSYYLSFRVKNGAGMTSGVISESKPLVYDETPPDPPQQPLVYVSQYTGIQRNTVNATYYPVATSQPDVHKYYENPGEIKNALKNAQLPQISKQWKGAQDPQSGIYQYEYIVSPDSSVTEEDFGGIAEYETGKTQMSLRAYRNESPPSWFSDDPYIAQFGGSDIKRYEPYYIHIRAINNAGNRSEIITLSPVTPTDPTAPWEPKMKVMNGLFGVRLYMTKHSFDPESGLKGYQYALGTDINSTDLRGFPSSDTVDFNFSNLASYRAGAGNSGWSNNNNNTINFINNNYLGFKLSESELPEGKVFVFIRAVNNQGKVSKPAVSGPIFKDNSPPESPSVSLSTQNDPNKIEVTADNLHDPESGIKKIEYKVYKKVNGINQPAFSWKEFVSLYGPFYKEKKYSRSIDLGNENLDSITVKVRVTNGAGEQNSSSSTMDFMNVMFRSQNGNNNNFKINSINY